MPFDNFYEESDKARRRWWKCFGLAFLLFIGYWTFALLTIPKTEGDRNLKEYLNKEERIRQVDQLCASLPKPEQFTFIEKESPKHYGGETSIIYRFSSDRQPEEIMPFFVIWFNDNGWKSIGNDGENFKKGKQMVTITVFARLDVMTGYEIQCYDSDY